MVELLFENGALVYDEEDGNRVSLNEHVAGNGTKDIVELFLQHEVGANDMVNLGPEHERLLLRAILLPYRADVTVKAFRILH